jgi:hypothetical protein
MSTKTPAFLLCETPIADKSDGRTFILHNREPRLLAEVHHFEGITDSQKMAIQKKITIGSRLDYGTETIYFEPNWIDQLTVTGASQEQVDRLASLMRRMADWYKAYLIWEDEQNETED